MPQRSSVRAGILFFSILLCILICGCSHAPTTLTFSYQDAWPKSAIIFIPGFYGSNLRDVKSKRTVFLTLREYLFGNRSLALFNDELQTPRGYDLEVEGVLGAISIVPAISQMDVYGKFVADLEAKGLSSGRKVIPFAYDWRGDLQASAASLSSLIEELRSHGCTQVDLVAHSMGGLIATYYLAYGSQHIENATLNWEGAKLVKSATFMGTPFDGVFSIFRNMQRGAKLGGNRTLLPADAVSSFPSSYMLMSPRAQILTDGDPKDKQLLDLYNPKLWSEFKLGLFAPEKPQAIALARAHFVEAQLKRARKFHELIDFEVNDANAPPRSFRALKVAGHGHPTVNTGFINRRQGKLIFDTDLDDQGVVGSRLAQKTLFADGDGTVTVESARLPAVLKGSAEELSTPAGHLEMINDPAVQERVFKILGIN